MVFNDPALGTNNVFFEKFALSPNPNNGRFNIDLKSNSGKNINVVIYDIRGIEVFSKIFNNTLNFSKEINLENAAIGVYLINVSDGDRRVIRKVIID
jgi:hypothetical protein